MSTLVTLLISIGGLLFFVGVPAILESIATKKKEMEELNNGENKNIHKN